MSKNLMRETVCFLLGIAVALAGVGLWTKFRPPTPGLRAALVSNPEFLADNPDILQGARNVLQTRALASAVLARRKIIREKWATLTLPAFAPTLGDTRAVTVLIEFTDYTCAPCKSSAAIVNEALVRNPDLRVALMFVPIGGAVAEYAARVAYAAYQQNPAKFAVFHQELMTENQPLTQQLVLDAAARAGLDVAQIQEEVSVQRNRLYIDQARMFAADLNIMGVPAFLLNGEIIVGGLTASKLNQMLSTGTRAHAI
jgi:protein-disulfide isomerase